MSPRLKAIVPALLVVAAAAPAARASGRSTHERLPFQQDFDRCTLLAEDRGLSALLGRMRLELLVAKEGNVYAAFVHSEGGIDDRKFERCLTDRALLWVLPAVSVDYERPYALAFTPGGDAIDFSAEQYQGGLNPHTAGRASAFMPDINDPAPSAPLDEKVAQDTVSIAEWATEAERATALTTIHRYDDAIKAARKALIDNATDPMALRSLSQALAESGGDLAEARSVAERLLAVYPEAEASHEALLRVCLVSGDDECAFAQYRAAHEAKDLLPRSRLLSELTEATRAAADRLRAQMGLQAAKDPCGSEKDLEAQTLCVVKRCLDEGSTLYAKELAEQDRTPYQAEPWRVKEVSKDRLLFTRPIGAPSSGGSAGSGASESATRHDALWVVRVGDLLEMMPSNAEARQITLRHNRCGSRTLGSR